MKRLLPALENVETIIRCYITAKEEDDPIFMKNSDAQKLLLKFSAASRILAQAAAGVALACIAALEKEAKVLEGAIEDAGIQPKVLLDGLKESHKGIHYWKVRRWDFEHRRKEAIFYPGLISTMLSNVDDDDAVDIDWAPVSEDFGTYSMTFE